MKCFHTVKSNSQCAFVCDCVCIPHKVSSNWESTALMLTVGLHAKITHTYAHTPTETKSVSPQCLFPPLLVRTLISGECQKVWQRERLWKICERQIFSVTPEFCFWLFYFISNIAGKTWESGQGKDKLERWWDRWRETGGYQNRKWDGATEHHVRSRFLSLLVSFCFLFNKSNLRNSTCLLPTQVTLQQKCFLWLWPASLTDSMCTFQSQHS